MKSIESSFGHVIIHNMYSSKVVNCDHRAESTDASSVSFRHNQAKEI